MDYGNINFGGDARRAHLALIDGGASTRPAATNASARPFGSQPIRSVAAPTGRAAATGYGASSVEAPRSRHESGVRAVARKYDSFEDALQEMVLASGVSRESAATVAEAIMGNPALKAQAERAFQRARISAV